MKIKTKNGLSRAINAVRVRFLFLGLLLMIAPVSTLALSEGDYTFVADENSRAIITGFSPSYSGALTIASTLGGYPVVAIGDSAFGCCSNLTSVTFQDGITRVGEGAFAGCTRLRGAYFMGNVPDAGTTVFNADSPTTVYYLPEAHGWGESFAGRQTELWQAFTYTVEGDSVTITGFSGPGNQMVIPASIMGKPVTAIGDHAFECNANLTGVAFPDTVLSIGSGAFACCSELKELRLPDRLTEIKSSAFIGCCGLTNVIFGCTVTTLGECAFVDCGGLTQLVLPDTLAFIGDYVFNYCAGLRDLYFRGNCPYVGIYPFDPDCQITVHRPIDNLNWPPTFAGRPVIEWEEYLYMNSGGEIYILNYNGPERDVAIPASIQGVPVVAIYDNAFANHSNLTSVTFPNSLRYISNQAFTGCTGLTQLDFPEGLCHIYDLAFDGCSGLKRVSLPMNGSNYYGWRYLGSYAFRSCTNLQEVVFRGDAPYTGSGVFENDTRCTVYYLPGKERWEALFAGCPTVQSQRLICTTNESSLTVTGYDGFGEELEIPSSLGGLPVVAIGDEAFYGHPDFSRVTIPNSVTSVGARAFQNCFGLKDVVFGSGVVSLGERAFARCGRLSQVTIPATASRIGAGAFAGCSSLHTITVEDGNPSYCSRDGVLFDLSLQTLIQCPGLREGIYDIPDSVTAVSDFAFENCFNLTRIMCPAGFAAVGSRAFAWCASLQAIYFRGDAPVSASGVFDGDSPATVYYQSFSSGWDVIYAGQPTAVWKEFESFDDEGSVVILGYSGPGGTVTIPATLQGLPVTRIEPGAFSDKYDITSVVIGNNITSIWDGTFSTCYQLASIHVASNNPAFASLDGVLFDAEKHRLIQCPMARTGSYTLPDSVVTVGSGAFANSRLSSVTFNVGAKEIGENAFYSSAVVSVTLSSSVTNMGGGAFNDCRSLTDVVLPEGLVAIGYGAFFYCESLQHITLPESLRVIGGEAFSRCRALADITIPAGVNEIGGSAFSMCYGLTAITVANGNAVYSSSNGVFYTKAKDVLLQYPPNKQSGAFAIPLGVTTVRDSAFAFSRVTSVTIPSSVTNIGSAVFYWCGGLTTITIPASVTRIPDGTFGECTYLASVTIQNGIVSIGANAFYHCYNLVTLNIPDSVTSIGPHAFDYCPRLTSVTFGAGLTSIGDYAFDMCTGLSTITIPENVTSIGVGAFTLCRSLSKVYFDGHVPSIGACAFLNTPAKFYYLPGRIGWGSPSICAVPGNPKVSPTFCNGASHPYVSALVTTLNSQFTGTVSEVEKQVVGQFEKADLMGLFCTDLTPLNVTNLVSDIAITDFAVGAGAQATLTAACSNGITSDSQAMARLLREPNYRSIGIQALSSLLSDASITNLTPTFVQGGATATATFSLSGAEDAQFFKLSLQRK